MSEKNIKKLYDYLFELADKTEQPRLLKECKKRGKYWPDKGVYFILDSSESSKTSGKNPKIVRIGTHQVRVNSKSTLWGRIKAHKGTNNEDGYHRSSVFRIHVGNAIIKKEGLKCKTWGEGNRTKKEIHIGEKEIEKKVSEHIGKLKVIVLSVNDEASPNSDRAKLEKNLIALISAKNNNSEKNSNKWLGKKSPRNEIRESSLWNIDYVDDKFDEKCFKILEKYIEQTIKEYKKNKKQ